MAAAPIGRLTLDLVVKLGSFEQGMTQAERKTKQTTDNMGKAFGSFKTQITDALGGTQIGSVIDNFTGKIGSIQGGILLAGAALTGMAVGGVAVAMGALSKMAVEISKSDAQLQMLSNRANTSVRSFQTLEYAALQFGVSQDQLGSILADTQEKLGEFSATEGGGAADFFDALKNNTKMTEDQIRSFAKTLQGKDGIEAIQAISDKLDTLDASKQERRFIFESLASDLGNLAPIFAENGQLLKEYDEALEQAGVLRSKEAMEQSRVLAAQTQSLQTRFEGFKSQLATQVMPVLSTLLSHFLEGSKNGAQFNSTLAAVGTIAKSVGAVVIGVAGAIEIIINQIKTFLAQSKNIGRTAMNVWNAEGFTGKSLALVAGITGSVSIAQDSLITSFATLEKTVRGASNMFDSAAPKMDPLAEVLYKTNSAANEASVGLKLNTKQAEENAKAKEKAAKEQEKLNKQLQVNAKVMSNAAKYNFSGIEDQYQLPKGLLSAINMQESRGNANAIGPMTKYGQAKGGFQFLDGTAKRFGLIGNAVFDTGKSAEAAAKYFQFLYQKFGTWEKAISAYHAGEGNVERGTGLGPINREYVKNVLGYMDAALKGVGTTAADAVKYVEEVYKSQQSVIFRYMEEREKLEYENAVSIQEIKDAFAENDPSREKYLKLQQLAYQKDVEEFKKAQQQKEFDVINSAIQMQERIRSISGDVDDIFAKATMPAGDYARWSLQNHRSNAQAGLKSQRVGVEQDIMTSDAYSTDDERYAALLEAHQEYRDAMAAIDVNYAEQVKELEFRKYEDVMGMYGSILSQAGSVWGDMTQIVKDSAGEQSGAYKAMFLMQQMFAIGSALVSTHLAAAQVMADPTALTMAQKTMYSSLILGMGYANVGLIAAQTISGMAHDGIDNIPKEGTWLLDKGERVVDSRTNSDLKNYLNEARNSNSGAKITINNNTGAQVDARQNPDGSIDIDVIERQLAGRLGNPNSTLSKSLKQNTTAARRR